MISQASTGKLYNIPVVRIRNRTSNLLHGFVGHPGWNLSWRSFRVLLYVCFPGKAWCTFPTALELWSIWNIFLSLHKLLWRNLVAVPRTFIFLQSSWEWIRAEWTFSCFPVNQVFPFHSSLHFEPSFLLRDFYNTKCKAQNQSSLCIKIYITKLLPTLRIIKAFPIKLWLCLIFFI